MRYFHEISSCAWPALRTMGFSFFLKKYVTGERRIWCLWREWKISRVHKLNYNLFQVLHLLPDSEVTQKHEVPQQLLNEMQKIHQLVRIYCPFTYNHFKNVSYKTYISSINCFWKNFVMKSRRPVQSGPPCRIMFLV